MHLRIWSIGRMENMVLFLFRSMFRSAPVMAFVLRQLGATVGKNLQCAEEANLSGPLNLISIEDDVAIQTGAYIQTTKWSGQNLSVGTVRLESGCKIGMRAAVGNNVTIGRGTWVTPFTAVLSDIGPHEMWEGSPASLSGGYTELKRTAKMCQNNDPIWLLEALNILMQIVIYSGLYVVPTAAISWLARGFILAEGSEISDTFFRITPLPHIIWSITLYAFVTTWVTVVVTSLLGCLFIRWTAVSPGLYPAHGPKAALLMYRMYLMNSIQRMWSWSITGQYMRALAGVRFGRFGRLGMRCDDQPCSRDRYSRLAGILVQWMFHQHARLRRRAL